MYRPGRARARWPLLWLLLLGAGAQAGRGAGLPSDFTVGGNLALTSDYIYRGVSESDGRLAAQADLHVSSGSGAYLGVWASTRDHNFEPYARYDTELYLGHHFALSNDWGVTVDARGHYYVGGAQEINDDYQQISASLTYLDRWTLSVTAIPNAVRYWFQERLSRTPAWVADTAAQWLIHDGLYLTGGAGYYYSSGSGPGIRAGRGYGYGSAGLAYEYRSWRLEVGYFVTQHIAQRLFPYPIADGRFAATLVWRF